MGNKGIHKSPQFSPNLIIRKECGIMKKQMKSDRMKYLLIGIVIGIIIGIALFYFLMTFRIIRLFIPFGFEGNFSRDFSRRPLP